MIATPIFLLVSLGVIVVGAGSVAIAELAAGRPRAFFEERRRADLRRRARLDPRAARELREGLLEDLARQTAVRRDLEKDRATGSKQAGLLRDIERAEQDTRNEIAQLEMWIGVGR